MKGIYLAFILIGLSWMSTAPALAQVVSDSTVTWRIATIDGNEYYGVIEEQNDESIRLRTENLGVLTIRRVDVKTMEEVRQGRFKNGEYWFDNPQSARYFWAPNGYALKEGEGYYQNVWVLFNQLSYGFSDHFSLGIGGVPLFLFAGAPSPVWITPKLSIPLEPDQANLGAGALIGTVAGAEAGFFGITYGVLTLGSRDTNFNMGLGYGFAEGQWAEAPAVTIGGMVRTSRRGYFITENYYIGGKHDSVLLISLGGRFVGSTITIDFGGFVPIYDTIEVVVPWLGIVIPTGRAKNGS